MDTHALLWWLNEPELLSRSAHDEIRSGANRLYVSAASIAEMAIKSSLGKLEVPDDLLDVLDDQGFEVLPIHGAHAWALARLPVNEHKDPFDRQIVAQALTDDLPVISADPALDRYGIVRLW